MFLTLRYIVVVVVVMVMVALPGVTSSPWQRRLDALTAPCHGELGSALSSVAATSRRAVIRWHFLIVVLNEVFYYFSRSVYDKATGVKVRCIIHCKNVRISTDILRRVFHILTEPVPYTFVSVN